MPSARSRTPGIEAKKKLRVGPPSPPIVADHSVPDELYCPITFDIMRDPVVCSTGHTYERDALLDHFEMRENVGAMLTCPRTGLETTRESVQPNWAMRGQLDRFLAEHAGWVPVGWHNRELAPAVAGGGPPWLRGTPIFGIVLEETLHDVFADLTEYICSSTLNKRAFALILFFLAALIGLHGGPQTRLQLVSKSFQFQGTETVIAFVEVADSTLVLPIVQRNSYAYGRSAERLLSETHVRSGHGFSVGPKLPLADDGNTTFCARWSSSASRSPRPPSISDVQGALSRDDHWVHSFLDLRHRWIHRAVRSIVHAGELARRNRHSPRGASVKTALEATHLMRTGLSNLVNPPGMSRAVRSEYSHFWVLGNPCVQKSWAECSCKCGGKSVGPPIGTNATHPFAYKNLIESALHRFFLYILATCPLPEPETQPNPFRDALVCVPRTGAYETHELAELAMNVLILTHNYEQDDEVGQMHTLKSCADVRIDRLFEAGAVYLSAVEPDKALGVGWGRMLRTVRKNLCAAAELIQKEREEAGDRWTVEDGIFWDISRELSGYSFWGGIR